MGKFSRNFVGQYKSKHCCNTAVLNMFWVGVCFYAVDELPEETCSMVLSITTMPFSFPFSHSWGKGRCADPLYVGCELSCCRYQQDTSSYDLESTQQSNKNNFVSTNMIVVNCLIAAIFFFFVTWHLCRRKHASMTNFLAQHDIVHLPEDKNVQTILPPLRKRLSRPKSESSERQYPPLPNFLGRSSVKPSLFQKKRISVRSDLISMDAFESKDVFHIHVWQLAKMSRKSFKVEKRRDADLTTTSFK